MKVKGNFFHDMTVSRPKTFGGSPAVYSVLKRVLSCSYVHGGVFRSVAGD